VCIVDVGGKFGRELSARGEQAMVDFAREWLGSLYGSDLKSSVQRAAATRWNAEPWTMGAMSGAAPGAQSSRRALAEALSARIWFAGEATHETLWGTVSGAWESGDRAAQEVLKRLAGPAPAVTPRQDKRRRNRRS
jgi:monoamine oxidase